jgi:hypothetical protein
MKFLKWTTVCGVAVFGFIAGWIANGRLIFSNETIVEASLVSRHGDAPSMTRADVMRAMNVFQAGYDRRDVRLLDGFMTRLFPREGEVLLLGTESNEWIHGFDDVKTVIRHDWVDWADLRLDLDDCQVSAAGDVAWVATRGYVYGDVSKRPVRFSATLERKNGEWKFRQLQYQYEDRHAVLRDFVQVGHFAQLHWN